MKFLLTPSLNDGKNDAPPTEVTVPDSAHGIDQLLNLVEDEMTNDYGDAFGVGFTLKIERTA